MALHSWFLTSVDRMRSQDRGPHPHYDHWGPRTNITTNLGCHFGIPPCYHGVLGTLHREVRDIYQENPPKKSARNKPLIILNWFGNGPIILVYRQNSPLGICDMLLSYDFITILYWKCIIFHMSTGRRRNYIYPNINRKISYGCIHINLYKLLKKWGFFLTPHFTCNDISNINWRLW